MRKILFFILIALAGIQGIQAKKKGNPCEQSVLSNSVDETIWFDRSRDVVGRLRGRPKPTDFDLERTSLLSAIDENLDPEIRIHHTESNRILISGPLQKILKWDFKGPISQKFFRLLNRSAEFQSDLRVNPNPHIQIDLENFKVGDIPAGLPKARWHVDVDDNYPRRGKPSYLFMVFSQLEGVAPTRLLTEPSPENAEILQALVEKEGPYHDFIELRNLDWVGAPEGALIRFYKNTTLHSRNVAEIEGTRYFIRIMF